MMQGGLATLPLLSVPHILASEVACYYHGYVLAKMGVYQTREHFMNKYGQVVVNPKVGQRGRRGGLHGTGYRGRGTRHVV